MRKLLVSGRFPRPCRTPTDELNIFQKVDLKDSAGAIIIRRRNIPGGFVKVQWDPLNS
jgi:hypothetical protein